MVVEVPRFRIAVASMAGTTIEFYDFYVYATAAVSVFPQLFFPQSNPTTALLASLATFGLAFVARPVGSILFGHFGDRIGRKATLIVSLLTMGIATFLIGLLPTYDQVGPIAAALLATMRFCQGLALGGEWSGAALLATETARPGRRGWAAMWPQMGAPMGFLLANVVFLVLITVLGNGSLKPTLEQRVLQLGLARSIPAEFGHGGDRIVCAVATGRDSGVHPSHRARRTRQSAVGAGASDELAPADHRHVRDRRRLLPVLYRDDLGAQLRH